MYSGYQQMKKKKVLSPINNGFINISQQQENSLNSKNESIMISRITNQNE
jgi:hypothetical protein